MSLTLRLEHVDKYFGGLQAVSDASLDVQAGSITGLIGPNGAGKSTLFNLITRVQDVTRGNIFVDDRDVTQLSAAKVASLGLARTFQTPRGFNSLSVVENVEVMIPSEREALIPALFSKGRRSSEHRDRAITALDTVGLTHRADEAYDQLSTGEHRLLEIARQLVREPRALMLDEPTAGVHPDLQEHLKKLLVRCHGEGMTIVVVEHNLSFLMSIATQVHVLTNGSILASGTPTEISRNANVLDAYLGRSSRDAEGA